MAEPLLAALLVVDYKNRRAVTAAILRGRGMFDGTPFERCSGTELCGTNRKGCAGVETLDTGVSHLKSRDVH